MNRKTENKTNKRNTAKKAAIDLLYFSAGGALYALSVDMFTAPNGILLGGFTGIGTILNYLFSVPIGTAVFLLNVPLFLIAFYKFGFRFIVKTVLATFLMSLLMDVFALFVPVYTGDKLLSALFGGILGGAGLGLVFLRGATTGGTDILSKLLRLRFPSFSMGRMVLLLDLAVIAVSFFVYKSLENVLYSLVVIYISAQCIDLVLSGFSHDKLLFMITEKGADAVREITSALDCGVSVLSVRGGYSEHARQMLFCATRAGEANRVAKAVQELDSNAFIVITETAEIRGEGFYRAGREI